MGERVKSAMTDLTVRTRKPGLYADAGPDRVRGLYLRVSPTGVRYFFIRYMLKGRRRDLGIGSYPEVSLAIARHKAIEARRLKAERIDPVDTRRIERAGSTRARTVAAWTFEKCAEEVHKTLSPGWKNPKHAKQWLATLTTYAFPKIGDRPVSEVDVAAILEVLRPIWNEKAETARRVRQRLDTVMTWAEAHGYAGKNPVDAAAALLPKQRDKVEHHRAIPFKDVPAFIQNLQAKDPTVGAMSLAFLILTAARTGEVRLALRTEFDLDKELWTIPAERMKSDREHRVPLSDIAVAFLKQAFAAAPESSLAFPGPSGRPLSDMALNAVMRRMNAPGVPHGFRSSFRDWCAENGVNKELAERALAHSIGNQTEAAYHRTDQLEQRRPLMEAWAAFVTGASHDDKVVQLRKSAG